MTANDRYRLLRSLFAMLVTTCILMVADFARADDPADTLFREGVVAINENNPPLAYEKFKAAWNLKQTFDIAESIAQAIDYAERRDRIVYTRRLVDARRERRKEMRGIPITLPAQKPGDAMPAMRMRRPL